MNPIVVPLVVALAVSAVSIALYDRFVIRPAMVIGIVDVGEVYRQKEAEFTLILTRAASDGEREKAMSMARAFAQRLPLALEELPRECGCIVVLRTALAAPAARTVDLTAQLKRKVELP